MPAPAVMGVGESGLKRAGVQPQSARPAAQTGLMLIKLSAVISGAQRTTNKTAAKRVFAGPNAQGEAFLTAGRAVPTAGRRYAGKRTRTRRTGCRWCSSRPVHREEEPNDWKGLGGSAASRPFMKPAQASQQIPGASK